MKSRKKPAKKAVKAMMPGAASQNMVPDKLKPGTKAGKKDEYSPGGKTRGNRGANDWD